MTAVSQPKASAECLGTHAAGRRRGKFGERRPIELNLLCEDSTSETPCTDKSATSSVTNKAGSTKSLDSDSSGKRFLRSASMSSDSLGTASTGSADTLEALPGISSLSSTPHPVVVLEDAQLKGLSTAELLERVGPPPGLGLSAALGTTRALNADAEEFVPLDAPELPGFEGCCAGDVPGSARAVSLSLVSLLPPPVVPPAMLSTVWSSPGLVPPPPPPPSSLPWGVERSETPPPPAFFASSAPSNEAGRSTLHDTSVTAIEPHVSPKIITLAELFM